MKKNTNREGDVKQFIGINTDASTTSGRYTEEDWRMANALGINPRKLLMGLNDCALPRATKRPLSPQFIRYLYQKQFGALEN